MSTFVSMAAALPVALSIAPPVDVAPFVAEAVQRTGIPETVIWAVIDVESRGQVRALSPKGAMGLMQLMPATWARLRDRLHLGPDPFDPHDNLIAGASYLRSLYDRYGWEGLFIAYNAGPGRYEAYRDRGQALPEETRSYIRRVSEKLSGMALIITPSPQSRPPAWTEAAVFVAHTDGGPETGAAVGVDTPFVDLASDGSSPLH